MAARWSTVGAIGPARIPWSTAAVSRGSAENMFMTLSRGPLPVRGRARKTLATRPTTGRAKWAASSIGHEGDGGGGQRPLEHRHLDHQAPDPLGGLGRHQEADVPAERDAADHRLVDAQVVEEGDDVVGVGVHAVVRRPLGSGRQSVAGQVEEDDPVALGGQVGGQAAVHVGVHQDAVEEDEDPGPAAVDLVVELQVVVDELADLVGRDRARVVVRQVLGCPQDPARSRPGAVSSWCPCRCHAVHGTPPGCRFASTGRRARTSARSAKSRSATTTPGRRIGPLGQHRAPRVDDHRVAVAPGHARRELADLAARRSRRPGPRRPGPAAAAPSGPAPSPP